MCAILEFHEEVREKWRLSPAAILSETVDEKRMRVIKPAIAEVYNASFPITAGTVFADINFCYEYGGNHITFSYLADVYGRVAGAMKWFNQKLKKHAKVPELAEYYSGVDPKFDVYAAMKEDFAEALNLYLIRHELEKQRWPDFNAWEPVEIRWDVVNERFKAASAAYIKAMEDLEKLS